MATTFKRRRRRAIAANESKFFRKENAQEQSFFSGASHDGFFHPQAQVQRKCEECEKEEKNVHRMAAEATGTPSSAGTAAYIHSLGSKGSPLSGTSQQFFRQKMGYDFSQVKIHTGQEASESAKAINAKAYAVGHHIVFKEGQYAPETYEGKKLLAHELTHVIQQTGTIMRKVNPTIHEDDDKTALGPVRGRGSLTTNKTNYGGTTTANVSAQTVANYDHGTFSTGNTTSVRATGCSNCGATPCATMRGIMVSVFHANPVITPPSMPSGLTPCQQVRVQNFITNVLMPHERQHVASFNTYNGTVNTPFNITACHNEQALNAALTTLHNNIDASRIASANAISDALDPFNTTIDIDCQEPAVPALKATPKH